MVLFLLAARIDSQGSFALFIAAMIAVTDCLLLRNHHSPSIFFYVAVAAFLLHVVVLYTLLSYINKWTPNHLEK